jgi:hypothetical protein
MPSPSRSIGAAFAFVAVAVAAFGLSWWLLGDGPRAHVSAPSVTCPSGRETLAGHDFRTGSVPVTPCADLHGAIFDGVDATQFTFSGGDLHGASFRGTDATQAEFIGANLVGAHFDHAKLGQADLRGADLRGAYLDGADLTQADLTGADLRGAHMSGVDMTQATVVGADLRNADLNTAGFDQADMTGADLRGASLWFAGGIQAQLPGVRLNPVQPGVIEIGIVAVAYAALAAVLSIVRPARGGLRVAGGVVVVTAFLSILQVLPLWTVHVLGWDALGAGILFLAAAIVRFRAPAAMRVPVAVPVAVSPVD